MSKYVKASAFHNIVIDDATLGALQKLLTEKENCEFDILDNFNKKDFLGKNYVSRLRVQVSCTTPPSFIISVVQLVNQRQGTMTKIFEIVKTFCLRNGINTIIVQSVVTEEMTQWCQKHGFTRRDDGWWLRDV